MILTAKARTADGGGNNLDRTAAEIGTDDVGAVALRRTRADAAATAEKAAAGAGLVRFMAPTLLGETEESDFYSNIFSFFLRTQRLDDGIDTLSR